MCVCEWGEERVERRGEGYGILSTHLANYTVLQVRHIIFFLYSKDPYIICAIIFADSAIMLIECAQSS